MDGARVINAPNAGARTPLVDFFRLSVDVAAARAQPFLKTRCAENTGSVEAKRIVLCHVCAARRLCNDKLTKHGDGARGGHWLVTVTCGTVVTRDGGSEVHSRRHLSIPRRLELKLLMTNTNGS